MKNIIRETVKEIEQQLHGSQDGFTPMEAQLVYNVLETLVEKMKENFEGMKKVEKRCIRDMGNGFSAYCCVYDCDSNKCKKCGRELGAVNLEQEYNSALSSAIALLDTIIQNIKSQI